MADESLIEDNMPRLKQLSEQIPKNIDFGFCAVGQETERTFKLTNYSSHEQVFSFAECPFKIEPIQDSIAAKQSKTVRISYYPTNATVVVASTIFRVDDEEQRVIKLTAIGKFPFLKTQNTKIDFEDVIYGKRKVKDLIIYNASEVSTYFSIKPKSLDEYNDKSFSLDVNHGVIPPKSSFLVKITYRPMIWDLYSCTHFSIDCKGGNSIEIQCVGKALAVEAKLSSKLVDFGSIRLNSSTNRMVTLHNNSDTNCSFEVIIDNTGIFSVKENVGVIKPKSYARLLFIFTPQKTINYYQRVYVMIRNHLALYMDLLGNCYDLLIKPPPLSPLVVKEAMATVGLGANASFANAMNIGDIDDPTMQDLETNKQIASQSIYTHKELFGSLSLADNFLKVNLKYLDFNFAGMSGVFPSREITLENVSGRRLSVFWTNDAPYRGTKDNVFGVYPASANIAANEIAKFTITFKPSNLGAFFFQKLQCFAIDYETNMMEKISKASFKMKKRMIGVSNLSSTQVQGELNAPKMIPPIELEVVCTGNSFGPETQPFIPMIQVVPKNELIFSPCAVGDTVYCSMQLINKTDTPSYFKFDNDSNETFEVFPKFGLIDGHKFKIIFFKFSPKVPCLQTHTMHCRLNNAIDVIRVKLTGYCCQPKLEIDNNCQIFFPPSFIGVHSKQKIGFHNRSRVPLNFFINVPKKYRDELMFGPLRSILLPSQTDYITCSLMPLKKTKYHIKVPIEVYGENSNQSTENQQLEVYGEGGDGTLVAKPDDVDFGIIKVNFYKMKKITIYNHSHVTFYLNLELKPQDETTKMDEASRRAIAESFHLDFVDGIITGHSKIEVAITFKPTEVCNLNVRLVCVAKEKPPLGVISPLEAGVINEKCSINLRAKGSFPILKVVDIRNEDLSVATLWDSFKLDNINNELLNKTYPGKPEVKDFEDLASTLDRDDIIEKNYFEWNFGYLQNKPIIEPRRIILTIQNVGGTDLDWKFKFPNDNQINAEPWADPGEQSEKEAYEKMILEKKIFEVHPRSGTLQPNQKKNIQLIYSPNMEEEIYDKKGNKEPTQDHKLRVILHIENGKSVKVLFRGKTLAHLQAQLYFRKETYKLPALPIGMMVPVIVPIQMENVGSGNIRSCEISKEDIALANKENGEADVFDIEEKETELRANEKKQLFVLFKPAEAKRYDFYINVRSSDIVKELESKRIHLCGWGYDTEVPHESLAIQSQMPNFKCSSDDLSPQTFFSVEELDFGEVSARETVSRVVILYNASNHSPVTFNFKDPKFICKDSVTIFPNSGMLQPQEHLEVKVTLVGSIHPSMYDGELECRVVWTSLDKKGIPSMGTYNQLHDDKKLGMGKQSSKNENSSMPSPKSSAVDRGGRGYDKFKDCRNETLFLRMKKKSKINVIEQRESLRVLSRGKDKESKADNTESLCNSILSKMIKEILASEQSIAIVDDILNQQPRLYCFFDEKDPIKVNNMKKEAGRLEAIEHMQRSQRFDHESPQQSMKESTLVDKQVQEKTEDEGKGSIDERRESSDREKELSDRQAIERKQTVDRMSRQESIKSQSGKEEQIRTRVLGMPSHLTPQDIIPESEQEDRKESQILDEKQSEPIFDPANDDTLKSLLTKDEFKTAAQTILDDIFLSLIKESVGGGLNLNEKQVRSSTRAPRHTLTRMRSQLSQGQQLSASNLKS